MDNQGLTMQASHLASEILPRSLRCAPQHVPIVPPCRLSSLSLTMPVKADPLPLNSGSASCGNGDASFSSAPFFIPPQPVVPIPDHPAHPIMTNAGTNKAASSGTTLNTRKLDEETENLSHEKVPSELKKNIMQARMDKKLTQSQLAQVIQEYESGKAIPNQQIVGKLERVLGVKLRGKK
ncbi:Multiprotein-bridging factor 1a [Platanthera zijinensis]|uniref:Multiprotein-bridging factor 1a n=1 Tax=Platanthera zijinensis TaxID=2320716 RepID=A0AAP0ARW6_9ASPA